MPVARIGFGVMQMERSALDKDAALAILRQAADVGVNHLDTAQFYGACNELIRDALAPYDAGLVLVSKVGAARDPDAKPLPLVQAQRPAELRAQVEANLASLGTDRLSVVNLRRLDAPPGRRRRGRAAGQPRRPARGAQRAARRGQDRRHRAEQRLRGPAPPGAARRDRVRAELLQRARPDRRARARRVPRARRRLGPVLPARLGGLPQHAAGDGQPHGARGRGRTRRHPRAGRPGLAARALRPDAADPGHGQSRPPGREHLAGEMQLTGESLAALDALGGGQA